jgi:hypothetical protein
VVAALAALGAMAGGSIASGQVKRRCVTPHGWRVVAKDGQAVVIAQRHQQYPAYDYCNRAVGKWRRMLPIGRGSQEQKTVGLRLAGRFVATWVPALYAVVLWDTRTGQSNPDAPGLFQSPPTFVLSPDGVLAAVFTLEYSNGMGGGSNEDVLHVLTPTSYQQLDDGPSGGLSNLQLYDCAAGCAPDTVIVAWTHSGEQRYAQVAG